MGHWFYGTNWVLNPLTVRIMRLGSLVHRLIETSTHAAIGPLRLLIKAIKASWSTLTWPLALLVAVQFIAALVVSAAVRNFINDDTQDLEQRQQVYGYYGTFSRCMITTFEINFANFSPACRVLLDSLGEQCAYLFLMYRCVAGFAVLNVVNAVFIQQTMKIAQHDHEVMVERKERL